MEVIYSLTFQHGPVIQELNIIIIYYIPSLSHIFNLECYYYFSHSTLLLDLPRVSLKLGPTLKADNIKEGDDVYFECSIKAKPKAYKIEWKFNVSKISVKLRILPHLHGTQ